MVASGGTESLTPESEGSIQFTTHTGTFLSERGASDWGKGQHKPQAVGVHLVLPTESQARGEPRDLFGPRTGGLC